MKKCENPLIPEITKTHTGRHYNLSDLKLPEGLRKQCVWCLERLKGAQRRWCGEECVNAATAWANPQKEYGLGMLLIRQEFKCKACDFDYGKVVEAMYELPRCPYGMLEAKETWRTVFSVYVVARLKDHLNVNDLPHRVEVDHIMPIYKGGRSLDIDNLQAICYTCHKAKTKVDLSGKRKKVEEGEQT